MTSTLRATLSWWKNIHGHNIKTSCRNLVHRSNTQHLVINRPSAYLIKPDGTLGGCLKLEKRSAWLFSHSLQNQQTDDKWHNMCGHHLDTNVLRSMIVVWSQRVVQLWASHENMNFQLKRGDLLHTLKNKNWRSSPSDVSRAVYSSANVPVHPDGTLGGCLKLKCRSAWFSSFRKRKNMSCLTTRAPTTVDNRACTARTHWNPIVPKPNACETTFRRVSMQTPLLRTDRDAEGTQRNFSSMLPLQLISLRGLDGFCQEQAHQNPLCWTATDQLG